MTFELTEGELIAERDVHFTRESLVRYAGASGDFNPIHYRDDIAEQVGLPGVLAHGMLTMGAAVQPVIDHFGDPGRILDYRVRFTRPVVVDAESGAELHVAATAAKDLGDGTWRVDLQVTVDGKAVLAKAQVVVRVA
ncbi:MAG TPA: acyl dehydratase [Candidatus Agrococcus pullicola]|uniref:Acyl dehydratase n=1 Tax=Candidatus Agrococcus pullicola TaxID=2838429 RepID=A0A9D1YVZ3_9MICO|nr:acyl dehydratase [Candidatus Agrococcus pullicola]